jgi:hypothetical protein
MKKMMKIIWILVITHSFYKVVLKDNNSLIKECNKRYKKHRVLTLMSDK